MNTNNAEIVRNALNLSKLDAAFASKPLIIGGLAMEYYGLRKRGQDIDLIITDVDYRILAEKYPKHKKDIWGDLGIVIHGFEIWRSIMLLDYNFFSVDAVEYDEFKVVSLDRLLLMRVMAMNVDKYRNDLNLMIKHYLKNQNPDYIQYMIGHLDKYKSVAGGIVLNDEY